MSAIAYFLELEGIQTTGISLVRENTESLRPPRFLWTSFALGRPLGVPGDPAFQRRVIHAALALLARTTGPVLEDFPEDAPDSTSEAAPACPIQFSRPSGSAGTWQARLSDELMLMRPWYELSLSRRGRTTLGVAKAPIEDLIERLAQALDEPLVEGADRKPLKYALEDLKTYYQESLTAQPGLHDDQAIQRRMWRETELGRAMLALYDRFDTHQNPQIKGFARAIAPRSEWQHGRTPPPV